MSRIHKAEAENFEWIDDFGPHRLSWNEREAMLRALPKDEKVVNIETSEMYYKMKDTHRGMLVINGEVAQTFDYHQLTCKSIALAVSMLKQTT